MNIDRLTSKLQQALAEAQSLAVAGNNPAIEPVHLLVALLDQEGGSIRTVLTQAGVNVFHLRSLLGEALERLPKIEGASSPPSASGALGRLLMQAEKLAQKRKDKFIASELIVLAALTEKDTLAGMLEKAGATSTQIEKSIDAMRDGKPISDQADEDQRLALERYTIDLTQRAEQGKLDPVIGCV